jgi:hypothetical protein
MPGCSGVTVVTNSYAFFIACEAAGALRARHSLRPLIFSGQEFNAKLGHIEPRDREVVASAIGCLKSEASLANVRC